MRCTLSWKLSGLLIEGQPQLTTAAIAGGRKLSGLLIEGQPRGVGDVKRLKGRVDYRLRIGDWRVIFIR